MPNKRYSIIGFNSHLLWPSSPIPGAVANRPARDGRRCRPARSGARGTAMGVEGMPGKPLTRRHVGPHADNMLHRLLEDVFQQKLQGSQLDYVVASRAAATSLTENYVGLPIAS